LKTKTAIIGSITLKEADSEQKGIIITMPVFSGDEKFAGVVFFTIAVSKLIRGFDPLNPTMGESWVIDSNENILYNLKYGPGKIDDQIHNIDPTFKTFLEKVKVGRVFTGEYLSPEGIKKIAVSHPIKIADQTWWMIIATPEETLSKLLKPFSIKYTIAILIALLVVASTSFTIIYLINRWRLELDSMVKIRTKELSLSEEKLRGMVETINDLIWEIDAAGKYTYISPIAKKIIGYEPEELIGKTIFDLMPEGDAQKLKATLQKIGNSKKPFNNLERINVNKDGTHIIFETNGAPILDDQGNLLGFRGADRNITARKQAEKELQKYAFELEEARNTLERKVEERTRELKEAHETLVRKEKFAVLGELAGGVSHELRNPLGVIKNSIYFLNMKMNTFKDEGVKENLKILSREITTANKIISDLLDFTRDKTPVRLEVNLNQLVEEMLLKSSIPANIRVITELTEHMVPISIDPTQVAQVFINLIENGLQAMAEGGGTLKVSTSVGDNTIDVIFADEGCGIPKDNLDKIFDPLFTTKIKGIGLGLAISKSMAEANGGSILVESDGHKRSIFTVRFLRKE
ncbi:MAG: PAS domain S-box protein, partial [Deltaproteobacteria bacterium]|nr:PAS domain S-box protein [Deltaproteobacteria bacterium]